MGDKVKKARKKLTLAERIARLDKSIAFFEKKADAKRSAKAVLLEEARSQAESVLAEISEVEQS